MPTYQYACTECGHRFEAVQSFTEDALTDCPQCTGRLRKVFNSVGIVFKGSGFYRTDSREKPGGDKPKADAAKGAGSGTDGSTKAPAAKDGSSGGPKEGSGGSPKPVAATSKPAASSTAGSSA